MRSHPRSTRVAIAAIYGGIRALRHKKNREGVGGRDLDDMMAMIHESHLRGLLSNVIAAVEKDGTRQHRPNDPIAAVLSSMDHVEHDQTSRRLARAMQDRRASEGRRHGEFERRYAEMRSHDGRRIDESSDRLDERDRVEIERRSRIAYDGERLGSLESVFRIIGPEDHWANGVSHRLPAYMGDDDEFLDRVRKACLYFTGQEVEITRSENGVDLHAPMIRDAQRLAATRRTRTSSAT